MKNKLFLFILLFISAEITFANYNHLKKVCNRSLKECEQVLKKIKIREHKCRITDGILKQQWQKTYNVNDVVEQSYTRTDWRVWNGKNGCYRFTSYDDRIYKVKDKFKTIAFQAPSKIIMKDDSFISKQHQKQIRNFYDTVHKKGRPLGTEEKYELYEQKHLKKDTSKREPCYGTSSKCDWRPTQFDTTLLSIKEILEIQNTDGNAKVSNYIVGTKFTDEDVKNFASGYYSISNGLIEISKENERRIQKIIEKENRIKERECWFEEHEALFTCDPSFFSRNASKKYRDKFGPKVEYYEKKIVLEKTITHRGTKSNGYIPRWEKVKDVHYFTQAEHHCENSVIPEHIREKIAKDNGFRYEDMPYDFCVFY
jgi:hypothetical protein